MTINKHSSPNAGKTPTKLKKISASSIPPSEATLRSDTLHISPIPGDTDPRTFYLTEKLDGKYLVPPPLISSSEFVPYSLITLLMRKKKNSAIGVKFTPQGGFRSSGLKPDEITNMEGAMHSFVTPVISSCEMIGDYRYSDQHGVVLFGDDGNGFWRSRKKLARTVVLSASIQMDFEGSMVMLMVCKLGDQDVIGRNLGNEWGILSTEEKQDERKRMRYDEGLREHMVYHLTSSERLPARRKVDDAMDMDTTINYLGEVIVSNEKIEEKLIGKFAELHNKQIVSLELLFNVAVHQLRNEFSALEAMCPQGYVYTYDPASIFAQKIGASALNRLTVAALSHLSAHNTFTNLRLFAFNDYADRGILSLAKAALSNQFHVGVVSKAELFRGPGGKYDVGKFKEAEKALLVIHNNSDGFGQNIETEWESGSLDGAVGSNSSGAASLERLRPDLLDFVSPSIKNTQ